MPTHGGGRTLPRLGYPKKICDASRSCRVLGVWHHIDKEIRLATIVIPIFSRERWRQSQNPNVLTEAAHARGIERPLIILTTDRAERLPFNWRHVPVIRYCDSSIGLAALREELLPRLRQEIRERKK